MPIKDVTDLEVYQLSLTSLDSIYKITSSLSYSQNNVKSQIIRSSESIAPLIAEGFGKKKAPKEFCRFLLMALGSSDETITHLRIISLQEISEDIDRIIEEYQTISKKINKLHSAWQKFS